MADWEGSLRELINGNQRFVSTGQDQPRQDAARRQEITGGQNPHTVILTCADSRVPPELIFDQGLGDLFVLRVAGNIIDPMIIASIEYAALHLETPLVVVMGHSDCGAMTATVAGGKQPGQLGGLVAVMEPAVRAARGVAADELVDQASRINARQMALDLERCEPILSNKVNSGQLRIISAFYQLTTGKVEFDTV
jgi:carbonic anhydrase